VAKLVVFGAKEIARLAHFYFTQDSPHEVVAFCVDDAYRTTSEFLGLPLVGFAEVERAYPPGEHQMFIAVGYTRMNRFRAEKYTEAKARGYTLVSYVSSRATMLARDPIGDNCFILEDSTVQPFSTIGHNVTLWSGSHIGHDSVIEDHCFLAPHAVVSGHCTVGTYSFLGVNATLRNAIHLAPHSLVGPGAVILKDTVEYGVYLAPPAKRVPQRSIDIDL
jgi:sugar O-acyltransferase (sialic acid O-acetyltransferase NeuD family)